MTTERELLKQVLVALKLSQNNISLCRMSSGDDVDAWYYYDKVINEIKAHLAKPKQEPVGYTTKSLLDRLIKNHNLAQKLSIVTANLNSTRIPLYTSPQKQEPLSDDVINDAFNEYADNFDLDGDEWEDMGRDEIFRAGIKSAEKAHGIGVDNETN